MFERQKIARLDDFFVDLDKRPARGVYFYRINAYSHEVGAFIRKYYEAARAVGVIIEGKLPNPDEKNLTYYHEMMGTDFQMDFNFILTSLRKWLPRMDDYQGRNVAASIYDTLGRLRKSGKNDGMLKNAYVKFMCWLYYKFERIVNRLGENTVPKILYEGTIGNYELLLAAVLSNAGCDVLLLQYAGDTAYLRLDPGSALSDELAVPDGKPFPPGFSLKWVREQIQRDYNNERLYGKKPELKNCTNAWITGNALEDIRQKEAERGTDPSFFYNCFCRMNGVEDKLTYVNSLYQFYLELKNSGRNVAVIDQAIPHPSNEEISQIRRKDYASQDQMLMDLTSNITYPSDGELRGLMKKAFLDVLLEEGKKAGGSLKKLMNRAVYLLCWLNRYQQALFGGWEPSSQVGCMIYMGGCQNETEALFMKMLARLPVDVLILVPNLSHKCCLADSLLYEQTFEASMDIARFPQESADVEMGTAAYYAERELDSLLYQDSGIYRNQQYQKANSFNLQTMYEEIRILWDEELAHRPNFSVTEGTVNVPVIFAKVSGVKDGSVQQYWRSVKELLTEDCFLVKNVPFLEPAAPNPVKASVADFLKNGRLQREKIKGHPCYQYGFLRRERQDYILDKLQALIDRRWIKGTFENGTEYTIAATILNLPKEILRLIQKFDFTKKNPKLVYINTGEKNISLEDSILAAFLDLIGFDIVFFVPTGYESVEKYFDKKLPEEHQIGSYLYDLAVPHMLNNPADGGAKTWRDKIFKRGR